MITFFMVLKSLYRHQISINFIDNRILDSQNERNFVGTFSSPAGKVPIRVLGRRIDAFKLLCWRRLLRVPWAAGDQTSQS